MLLDLLEDLQLGGGGVGGQDAVVALNHLKRLEGQGTQIKDKERMVRLMRALRYARVLARFPGTWRPPVGAPVCTCMRLQPSGRRTRSCSAGVSRETFR